MINNPHYLYRMTVLLAVASLAPVVSHDVLCNTMLPVVLTAAKDKVPLLNLVSESSGMGEGGVVEGGCHLILLDARKGDITVHHTARRPGL